MVQVNNCSIIVIIFVLTIVSLFVLDSLLGYKYMINDK